MTLEQKPEYLYKPLITQVMPGMMVRANYHGDKNYGTIVGGVEFITNTVLVGESIGGTKERWVWIPIANINVVWSVGTYDDAMAMIRAFDSAMKELVE